MRRIGGYKEKTEIKKEVPIGAERPFVTAESLPLFAGKDEEPKGIAGWNTISCELSFNNLW